MKQKRVYTCSACGAQSLQWRGQCAQCREWNTLEEKVVTPASSARPARISPLSSSTPVSLMELAPESSRSFSSGVEALDVLLGRGLVPGGAMLLGGAPGIGKSTLLLQVAGHVASAGKRAVYVSGEESLSQIRDRAERLGVLDESLLALSTSRVEDALDVLENEAPALLVVDSVQTMASPRTDGLPGSMSQVRAVSTELIETAKLKGVALVLVGHITKDGQIAGPMLLEHMVDTVLSLEGDRRNLFRIVRVLKNRFGPNQELLVFRMVEQGMEVVHDPSTLFLGARDPKLSGTAVVMAVDGRRPFAVEVQALVTRSFLSIPRRTGLGFDVNRLHLLLAVLEKRLRLNLGQVDVYAKIGGGLKMQDPGLDAGLVAAVLSSFYDLALPERAAVWGEVDLNGQIRPVPSQDIRAVQAQRLGYDPIVCPRAGSGDQGVDTLPDLQRTLFGK